MSLNKTLERAAKRLRPVTLTHEERRRLIESFRPTFNIIGRHMSAGTCVVDESGLNREFTPTPRGTGMWRIRGQYNHE